MLATLPKSAREMSALEGLEREYTLQEIAILTRAGPARILGIEAEHGHLGPGAVADVTVYEDEPDRERMFERPHLVLKGGVPIVRDGSLLPEAAARRGATHIVRPGFDAAIERRIAEHFLSFRGMRPANFKVADEEILERGRLTVHPCRGAPS
jgi:formylmethanofuran dehydrogenase subunit A